MATPSYADVLLQLISSFSICLEDNYKLLGSSLPKFFLITERWTEPITLTIAQHTAGGNNYLLAEVTGVSLVDFRITVYANLLDYEYFTQSEEIVNTCMFWVQYLSKVVFTIFFAKNNMHNLRSKRYSNPFKP